VRRDACLLETVVPASHRRIQRATTPGHIVSADFGYIFVDDESCIRTIFRDFDTFRHHSAVRITVPTDSRSAPCGR
jgi:hypothetical protein